MREGHALGRGSFGGRRVELGSHLVLKNWDFEYTWSCDRPPDRGLSGRRWIRSSSTAEVHLDPRVASAPMWLIAITGPDWGCGISG